MKIHCSEPGNLRHTKLFASIAT